jgi:hypothetical protein
MSGETVTTLNEHVCKAENPWTEVVTAKRAIRDAQIRKHQPANRESGLDTLGTEIVEVEVLTNLLRAGQVSAEALIRAYIGR